MRKTNSSSTRQRLLTMEVGGEIKVSRDKMKVSSLSSMLFALKRDENRSYSYETGENFITVTRKS